MHRFESMPGEIIQDTKPGESICIYLASLRKMLQFSKKFNFWLQQYINSLCIIFCLFKFSSKGHQSLVSCWILIIPWVIICVRVFILFYILANNPVFPLLEYNARTSMPELYPLYPWRCYQSSLAASYLLDTSTYLFSSKTHWIIKEHP
jgi:hypothetical protein